MPALKEPILSEWISTEIILSIGIAATELRIQNRTTLIVELLAVLNLKLR